MAAKTPDSIVRENVGSLNLLIATFSSNDIDDGDTWATGLGSNIVGVWGNLDDDPSTQTNNGIDIGNSSGTLTFYTSEDNRTGKVYVLTRS